MTPSFLARTGRAARRSIRKRALPSKRGVSGASATRYSGLPMIEALVPPQATVMVVEDDLDLREMIEMLLTVEGLHPVPATNGREALRALHGDEPRPDVILLDLMMPEMNGWQFREAQLAEPELAGIPVIVMSAVTERAIDGVPFIKKPFDSDQLLAAIHRAVPTGRA